MMRQNTLILRNSLILKDFENFPPEDFLPTHSPTSPSILFKSASKGKFGDDVHCPVTLRSSGQTHIGSFALY